MVAMDKKKNPSINKRTGKTAQKTGTGKPKGKSPKTKSAGISTKDKKKENRIKKTAPARKRILKKSPKSENTRGSDSKNKWRKYLNNEELYEKAYENGLENSESGENIDDTASLITTGEENSLSEGQNQKFDKAVVPLSGGQKNDGTLRYDDSQDLQMSFVDHLEEFRKRFINILLIFGIFAVIALSLSEYLVSWLQEPYTQGGNKLITTRPTGAFLTRLKVALMASLVLSIPSILHQVWLFIFPALSGRFKKLGIPLLIFAFILFVGGVAFNYFIVLPIVLQALQNIVWEGVEIVYNIDDYYDFVTMTSIMFGAIFEMPIFVLIFVRIGILSHHFLIRKWRYSLVIGAVIAAILTPPDAVSLLMMLFPMVLLYCISVGIAFIFRRRQ